jgi:hypothetical protein
VSVDTVPVFYERMKPEVSITSDASPHENLTVLPKNNRKVGIFFSIKCRNMDVFTR